MAQDMSKRSYASMARGGSGSGGDDSSSKRQGDRGSSSQTRNQDDKQKSNDSPRGRSKSPRSSDNGNNNSNDKGTKANSRGGAYTAAEYQRSQFHIPRTQANRKSPSPNGDKEEHYVLTLLTDQPLHDYLTSLRHKYFPAHLNRLDAHITLFHALPGSHLGEIVKDIRSLCARESPFPITAEEPYSPKLKNIFVRATSPRFAMEGLRKQLKERWIEWLSEQDAGGFRPHYTLLNKVDDTKEVEKRLKECNEEFERKEGEVQGLVLWRYDRGAWKDKKVFGFGEDESGKNEGDGNGRG